MQEVELLNKALEKALRVRGTSSSETSAVKMPSSAQRTQSHPTIVEKPAKQPSKTVDLRTKSAAYRLNPPYRTNPEKKRVCGSGRATSNGKSVLLASSAPPGRTNDNNTKSESKEELKTGKNMIGSSIGDSSLPAPSENLGDTEPCYVKLKHIGASLKLPMEYRREYTRNNKLWEKFYEIQNIISSPQPLLMEMLQETFVAGSPRQSLAELEEETLRLKMAVTSIQQRIDITEKWPAAGSRHWLNYRALMSLEVLQEELAQDLLALRLLKQDVEQYLKWDEGSHAGTIPLKPRCCPASVRLAPPLLVYNQFQELSQLTRCRLRILELQQKIYLQKVLSAELLSEADSCCHDAPESWMLFRAIYTQLCEGGDRFPVLVREDN
ncbi:tubulin epsilon and delta complex protein 2 isoform X2 [Xenopus laevis]|nr:tubulin epsilon and delta complex protein 2 isoform X2 [Xenopus laevis]